MARSPKTTPAVAAAPVTSDAPTTFSILMDAARKSDKKFEDRGAKESEQAFLNRLARAIGEIPEADWNALGEGSDAQKWFDASADAITAKTPIALPDGMNAAVAAVEPEPEPAAEGPRLDKNGKPLSPAALRMIEMNKARKAKKDAEAAAGATGAKTPEQAKTEKAAKAAAPKAPKAPKEPKAPKTDGVVITLRKIILEDRTRTVDQMYALAVERGGFTNLNKATVASARTDTLATYNLLASMGAIRS